MPRRLIGNFLVYWKGLNPKNSRGTGLGVPLSKKEIRSRLRTILLAVRSKSRPRVGRLKLGKIRPRSRCKEAGGSGCRQT
jgi:hypothetical protein